MNVEKFAQCCLAKVCRDERGHTRLTVCCILRDPNTGKRRVHVKEVNLDPLLKWASSMFTSYHNRMHAIQEGLPSEAHIAGDWEDTVRKSMAVARRIGESRLVMALYSEVSPMLSQGNGEDSDMYRQAHEVLQRAMRGDQQALAIMSALMNSAYRGNSRALEIMTLMRDMHLAIEGKEAISVAGLACAGVSTPDLVLVGSWWKKLKKGLKKVAKGAVHLATAPITATYKLAKGDFRGALSDALAPVTTAVHAVDAVPGLNLLNKINPAAWATHALEGGGNEGGDVPDAPETTDHREDSPPDQPPAQNQPPAETAPVDTGMPQDQPMGPPADSPPDDGDGDDGCDDGDAQVSGWFYNKGYRTVPEVAISKFPGLGLALREMYHRGSDSAGSVAVVPVQPTMATTVDALAAAGAGATDPTVVSSGEYLVGLSWHSLMRKAHNLAHTVSTATHAVIRSDIYKSLSPIIQQVAPLVAKAIPYGGVAMEVANHIHDIVQQAKRDHPEALQAVAAIRQWANNGDEKALEVANVMKNMSDAIDQKAASRPPTQMVVRQPVAPVIYYRDHRGPQTSYRAMEMASRDGTSFYRRGMGHHWFNRHLRHLHMQPQVGGWLYNKPYRSVLSAPGMGLTMRELYNRGEGRDPTTLMDVLRQVFPLGVQP